MCSSALILVYLAIMASKLGRIGREIGELDELVDERRRRAELAAADEPTAPAVPEEARR